MGKVGKQKKRRNFIHPFTAGSLRTTAMLSESVNADVNSNMLLNVMHCYRADDCYGFVPKRKEVPKGYQTQVRRLAASVVGLTWVRYNSRLAEPSLL